MNINMKNKYNIKSAISKTLLSAAFLGLVAACDPLGIEPTTMVDEDRFWENAQLSRSYVNQFYTWTPVTANHDFKAEQWSDNCIGNYEGDWDTYRQLTFTNRQYDALTASVFSAPWSDSYKHIRAVNLGIERISSSPTVQENDKNQYLAECHFFRAWIYFELEQYWGTVPYVDRVLTVNDETMIPRCPREQLFDYMLADLDKASEYFSKTTNQLERGRVGEDAVQTFKSRVALYAACAAEASEKGLYSYDDKGNLFKFTKTSQSYYQTALDAASKVLGKYSLEPKYADLFTSESSHKSVESIWPMMFNLSVRDTFNPTAKNGPDGYYYTATKDNNISWDFRSGLFPTQDLVDCYYQKDAADGKWKQWWKTKQATVDMGGTVDKDGNFKAETTNYSEMYKDRDERFYSTVTYDGSYMGPEGNETYLINTWIDNSDEENSYKYSSLHTGFRSTIKLQAPTNRSSAQTITGYYSRKYSHFDSFNNDGSLKKDQRTTCFFMLRYAEVLLNYAEAAIKLNRESDALPKINEIRNRAGLDNFDPSVVGHDLWEEYKLQRRIEFAFEVPAHRYYDLLRWGESDGKSTIEELNRGPKAVLIFCKGVESQVLGEMGRLVKPGEPGYFVPKIETRRFDYSYYLKKFDNSRYYFMPFMETMMTSYQGLIQNPGWTNFKYEQ